MKIKIFRRKFFLILLFLLSSALLSLTPTLSGFMIIEKFDVINEIAPFMFLISLGILFVTYAEVVSKKTDELLEKMRKRKYIHREKDEKLYKIDEEEPELYVLVKKAERNKKEYRGCYAAPSETSYIHIYSPEISYRLNRLEELGVDLSKSTLIYLEHKNELYTAYLFSHEYGHKLFWKELYTSISEEIKKLKSKLSELNIRFNELYGKELSIKNENMRNRMRSLPRLFYYVGQELELLKSGVVPGSLRKYNEEHSMITSILVLLQYLKEGKLKRDEFTKIIQKMIKTYTSPKIEASYEHAIKDLFGNFSDKDQIWRLTSELMYGTYDREITEIVNSLIDKLEEKRKEVIEKAKIEIQKGVSEAEDKLRMIERELYELHGQK